MSTRSCSAGEATPEARRRLRRWTSRVRTALTDRLVELDRLGRGHDLDGVLLDRDLEAGTDGVERGAMSELRGASDPPGFGGQDRRGPALDDAA